MEQHAGHAVTPASDAEWVACRHACVSRRAGTLPLAGERANPRHCRLKPCQVQTRAFRPLGRTRECDVPCPCFLQWGQRTAIIVISPGNEDQEQDRALAPSYSQSGVDATRLTKELTLHVRLLVRVVDNECDLVQRSRARLPATLPPAGQVRFRVLRESRAGPVGVDVSRRYLLSLPAETEKGSQNQGLM